MFGDAKLQHDNLQKNNLLLDIEANSNSVSIRANTAVFNNVYYYECQILTGGSMLIGWSSMSSVFRVNEGVGDEKNSYGYDGSTARIKNNNQFKPYGETWIMGDIIGTLIDL
jgi:hypothetical protein